MPSDDRCFLLAVFQAFAAEGAIWMFKAFFKLFRLAGLSMGTISLLGWANSANASPLFTLDGPSPFANCDIAGEEGENFPEAEVEPWIDVNPTNPKHLIAGWQQDRWSNGGARSLLSAYSTNGGKSCSAPQVLMRDTDGRAFNDKNAMSTDPNNANYIYAVWDRLFDSTLPAAKRVHGDAAAGARARRPARHNRTATTARPAGWFRCYRLKTRGLIWLPLRDYLILRSYGRCPGDGQTPRETPMTKLKMMTSALSATLLSGVALFAIAGVSQAVPPPTLVSFGSPFGGCSIAGEPGTNFLNAEVEPWIDINPLDPNNLVAGWQQDRWSNGGARGLMSGYSNDGGATWANVIVPGISKCSGGTGDFAYDRSTDPWVTFSPDGSVYFMSLSFNNDRPDGGGGANAMLASKSTDGGASWSPPQVLIRDTDGRAFNDKNAMTADPFDSNYVYAVWDRLFDNTLPSGSTHGDGVANARARHKEAVNRGGNTDNFRSYRGPAYFARTANGGVSWEPAKMIFDPGANAQTIANQVVVLNDGSLIDFYTQINHNGQTSIGYVKSSDHGATFGPGMLAVRTSITTNGTITPDAKESVRDGNILFDLAIDRGNGNLYLVWQDGKQQNIDRVAFSMSINNGSTWSQPVIINKTPTSTNKLRNQAFIPSVEVGTGGKVYVTYYDFRNDKTPGGELTDVWAISCSANCATPNGWGNEVRLTNVSFDMLYAPIARGHFLGDYMGLVSQGAAGVRALYGIAVGPNSNEMVTSLTP